MNENLIFLYVTYWLMIMNTMKFIRITMKSNNLGLVDLNRCPMNENMNPTILPINIYIH